MVNLLNSPTFQELPGGATISPFPGSPGINWQNMISQMVQLMAAKAMENKAKTLELQRGSREQASKSMEKLISEGATPSEAWGLASQSMPSFKRPEDQPWMTNENWGVPLPNLQNIWGNIQNRINVPAPTFGKIGNMPKLRSQRTLSELGIKLPKNLSWLGGLTTKESDQLDQLVKWSMMAGGLLKGGGGLGSDKVIDTTTWQKAKNLVEAELSSDPNFVILKVDDPVMAGYIMDSRIREKYDQFMNATIGKPSGPAAPAGNPGNPGKKPTVGVFLKNKSKGRG